MHKQPHTLARCRSSTSKSLQDSSISRQRCSCILYTLWCLANTHLGATRMARCMQALYEHRLQCSHPYTYIVWCSEPFHWRLSVSAMVPLNRPNCIVHCLFGEAQITRYFRCSVMSNKVSPVGKCCWVNLARDQWQYDPHKSPALWSQSQ